MFLALNSALNLWSASVQNASQQDHERHLTDSNHQSTVASLLIERESLITPPPLHKAQSRQVSAWSRPTSVIAMSVEISEDLHV